MRRCPSTHSSRPSCRRRMPTWPERCSGRLARTEGAGLAGLAKGLESEDVEVRRRATSAISGIHTEEATRALKRALDDSDAIVRADAALTLGSRGEAVSMPALLEMVADGRRDVEAGEVLGPSRGALTDKR